MTHESGFHLHFVFVSLSFKNLDLHQYCLLNAAPDTQLLAEPQPTSPTFSECECVFVCACVSVSVSSSFFSVFVLSLSRCFSFFL